MSREQDHDFVLVVMLVRCLAVVGLNIIRVQGEL